ncbi:acyclic terpene utilization AtuA family protein [Rhodococcoides yunnanense]|uniref:acyclic terpene utilization AtuA family protein n=1 Tax=Rhodococcoides yunnanense TaxID=278209 RepID=UPI0009327C3A|nr:acyclic terpene utilization AtuA family protein [Rhodococcus yunnanensis]
MTRDKLIVANCSGFFGDRISAAREVVEYPDLDVLTGDWLAELTMLILQKQHARDPLKGFASTFLIQVEEVLGTCIDRGIKIVSNAGGINPDGCAEAVQRIADRLGLSVSVGSVSGDNIVGRVDELVADGSLTRFDGRPFDETFEPVVANAYLGGWGITASLNAGADIVVTGRVTDAALVTGAGAWGFGWATDQWNELAGAVIAGHIIECGAQATGGNYAFYDELGPDPRLGFPVAELEADGSSTITKVQGTGGVVSTDTVTAQLLYEIQSDVYHNPDVSVLLDTVELQQVGPDRVNVAGVRGVRPPDTLKVSMGEPGGWRNDMTLVLTGLDAQGKAAMAEAAIWDAIPGGQEVFDDVSVELIGHAVDDPATVGAATTLLRIAVSGQDEKVVGRAFSSAVTGTGLASYPGFYTINPPRPASSFARFVPGLVQADRVVSKATVDGTAVVIPATPRGFDHRVGVAPDTGAPPVELDGKLSRVSLGSVYGARSGDKGGNANVGLWARTDQEWEWLHSRISTELMSELLPGDRKYDIERVVLPKLRSLNFVVKGWLGHGVASNLALDSQAKGLGEFIRARLIWVPEQFTKG